MKGNAIDLNKTKHSMKIYGLQNSCQLTAENSLAITKKKKNDRLYLSFLKPKYLQGKQLVFFHLAFTNIQLHSQ